MSNEYLASLDYTSESNLNQSIQGIFSAHQAFLQNRFLFAQSSVPPLFIVPTFFSTIQYEFSRLVFSKKPTKPPKKPSNNPKEIYIDDILLPEVDLIISGFANSYRALQFSLRFIQYIKNPANRIQLLIADNPYSQESLKFYKSNPLNIKQLENLIASEEIKYRSQLAKVTYILKMKQPNGTETQTTLTLNKKHVDGFIKIAKDDADKDYLNKFFQQGRALIIQNARFTEREYSAEELVDMPEIKAMLDLITYAEGTGAGYGTIVKGKVEQAKYFPELIGKTDVSINDFSKFPEIYVRWSPNRPLSSAAGRYQINSDTWIDFGRGDFSPRSQDMAAVRIMMRENMVVPLLNGDIRQAIFNGGTRRWMSFPFNETGKSAASGQPAKPIGELLGKYNEFLTTYQN